MAWHCMRLPQISISFVMNAGIREPPVGITVMRSTRVRLWQYVLTYAPHVGNGPCILWGSRTVVLAYSYLLLHNS